MDKIKQVLSKGKETKKSVNRMAASKWHGYGNGTSGKVNSSALPEAPSNKGK